MNQRLASGKGVTPRDIALVRDAYDDCLAYLDEQLGRLFDELERRGQLANTLVIVTADHGEHLGEHQIYGHGQSLYRPEVHVPLLIIPPSGAPGGREHPRAREPPRPGGHGGRRRRPRRQVPLPRPHARPLLGSRTGPGRFDRGPRLLRAHPGGKPSPDIKWPPALRGPMRSLLVDGKTYIRNGDGVEELYDLDGDPAEVHDLSGPADSHGTTERLRAIAEELGPEETRRR